MTNKRITDISETTSLDSNSYLLVDSTTNGTNKVSPTNFPVSTATQTALDNKVDKVTGKGLTKNELTDALKSTYDTAVSNINSAPTIYSGSGAPSSTPLKIGDLYIDITNSKLYFAKGTSSSANWIIAN